MPWVKRRLRGQEVLARCDERGALVSEGGRVEIRYGPKRARAYRAGASNLAATSDPTLFPDEHCVPGEAAPDPRAKPETGSRGTEAPRAGATSRGAAATTLRAQAEIVAYGDGACTGNPGPAGVGALIIDGAARHELSEYLGPGTNNIAELTAILRVAERLEKEVRSIEIRTDSQYSIGVLSKGWKAKANQALVAECKGALGRLASVRLAYVAGHSGEPGNERVDELAREAIVRRGSLPWKVG